MRKEFDLLCSRLKTDITDSGSIHPLFEITTKSLAPWISQTSKNYDDEDILETPHEGVVLIAFFLIIFNLKKNKFFFQNLRKWTQIHWKVLTKNLSLLLKPC